MDRFFFMFLTFVIAHFCDALSQTKSSTNAQFKKKIIKASKCETNTSKCDETEFRRNTSLINLFKFEETQFKSDRKMQPVKKRRKISGKR